MLGFRISAPGPFWLEDLVFATIDETRRVTEHAKSAAKRLKRRVRALHHAGISAVTSARFPVRADQAETPETPAAVSLPREIQPEAELLDEPLAWTLTTEPLVEANRGARNIVTLQRAAEEQLGAISYILDRLKEEIAPVMTRVEPDKGASKAGNADKASLDLSIEALLALSRANAATRPKARLLDAAHAA